MKHQNESSCADSTTKDRRKVRERTHRSRIHPTRGPSSINMRPVDCPRNVTVHPEARVDARYATAVDQLGTEVEEAVAEGLEEGEVREPVEVLREGVGVSFECATMWRRKGRES